MILFLCFAGELHVIIFVLTGVLAPVDCSGSILMVSQTQNLSRIETSLGSWNIDVPMLLCRFSSKNIHKTHKTTYPAFLRISQSLQGFHDKIGAKKKQSFSTKKLGKNGTCYPRNGTCYPIWGQIRLGSYVVFFQLPTVPS